MRLNFRNFDAYICSMLTKKARYLYRTDCDFRKHWRDMLVDVTTLAGKHFFNMQRKYVFAMQDLDECRNIHEVKRFFREIGIKGNDPWLKEAKEQVKKSRGVWSN